MNNLSGVEVIVTDLDGTLFLPGTEEVPAEFFEKINNWRAKGGLWIVATGRPDERLKDFFEDWEEIPDFYIVEERYIFSVPEEGQITPFSGWNQRLKRATHRVKRKHKLLVEPLLDWIEETGAKVEVENHTFVFEKEKRARQAAQLLAEDLPEKFKPLRNRVHLAVAPCEIGKGRCLEEIIERIDYRPSQLFCLGDSANDLDMLDGRYGYFSATVANAEDKIKEVVRDNGGTVTEGKGGRGPVECLERLLAAKNN